MQLQSNNHSQKISFRGIKSFNNTARKFSQQYIFPAHTKIPDGFQFVSNVTDISLLCTVRIDKKGACNSPINQITVVDRKKDKALQQIIKDHAKGIERWKREYEKYKLFGHKTAKFYTEKGFLAHKTVLFLRKYQIDKEADYKNNRITELFNTRAKLGDINLLGLSLCRHNSFLFKILMDEHNLKSSVIYGTSKTENNFSYHAWNIANLANKDTFIDTSMNRIFPVQSKAHLKQYADINFNPFCEPPHDLVRVMPLSSSYICIDPKTGKYSAVEHPEKALPLLEVAWSNDNRFYIRRLDNPEIEKIRGKKIPYSLNFRTPPEQTKPTLIHESDSPSFITLGEMQEEPVTTFAFDGSFVRADYSRKISQACRSICNQTGKIQKSFEFQDIHKNSPDLDPYTLNSIWVFKPFREYLQKIAF